MGEHWSSIIIDLLWALLSGGNKRVRSEAVLCMPQLVEAAVLGNGAAAGGTGTLRSWSGPSRSRWRYRWTQASWYGPRW